ncbi:MAG TPA: hypothetical protein VF771_01010, partial [Longimicrobiaceae bacterium]
DDTTWVAPAFDRPDTLTKRGSEYVRTLPGRAEVHFNLTGQHVLTVNRLGQRTTFNWSGDFLASIYLPVEGYAYSFTYGSPYQQLTRISVPNRGPSRDVLFDIDPTANSIQRITEPGQWLVQPNGTQQWQDGPVIRFGFGSGDPRIASRTDRRGNTNDFRYGAGGLLSSVRLRMDTTAVFDSLVWRFRPQEAQGLADSSAVPVSRLSTRIDGPRLDVADTVGLTLDRWGAPVVVRDALGNATRLTRGDPRWPAAVTSVLYPNGREVTATYDARGHPASSTDWSVTAADGRRATTTYDWDPYWDALTRATAPEGEVAQRGYTATGEPAWAQPGRSAARRVSFEYRPLDGSPSAGFVSAVRYPDGGREQYGYDLLGNLASVTTPRGNVTQYLSDNLGRDTLVIPAAGARTRTLYDVQSRAVRSVTFSGSDSLIVHTIYDPEGRPTRVMRTMVPDVNRILTQYTDWRYDAAGRRIWEKGPAGTPDSTVYDPAGQVVEYWSTRRDPYTSERYVTRMRYDELGRLVERITPQVRYQPEAFTAFAHDWSFPSKPLDNEGAT